MSILSFRTAVAAALVGAVATAAHAASTDRFTMSPVDGGFVRLDKETGAMSLCTKQRDGDRQDGWSCTPMDDNQRDLRDEIDRLKAENAELKDEIRRLEDTFIMGERGEEGSGRRGGPPGGLPPGGMPELQLPSEEDVDQAVDYLERMIRKFRERFEDFGDKTDPNRAPRGNDAPGNRRDDGEPRGSTPL